MPKPTRDEVIHLRLSEICFSLPGTTEVNSWGHPNFRAGGRIFAALEAYKGVLSIAVRASEPEQELLLADPRFTRTPHAGGMGWVSLNVEGRIRWSLVKELCGRVHALATESQKPPKRKSRDRK